MRALAALLLAPAVAAGQSPRFEVGGTSVALRVHSSIGPAREALSGTVFGGEARVNLWRVVLEAGYAQGRVQPDSAGPVRRDVVDGRLFLGNRPWRGLSLKVGPHARAYLTNSGTQRWFFWEARLRGERPIVGTTVRGYAEIWHALTGSVNVVEAFDGAQGGEAGMVVTPPRSPAWGRLAYGIERAKLGRGWRLETVEGLTLTVGLGWR